MSQENTFNFLKLTGLDWSYSTKERSPFEVKNGERIPIRNADVNGHFINDQGKVSFLFAKDGTY